jgi:hypothetical protein
MSSGSGSTSIRAVPLLLMAWLGAATTSIAADPTPCQVLSEEDVKNVMGVDWQPFPSLSKSEACAYRGSGGKFVTLILTADSSASGSMLATRRQMAGDKAKPAPGPGTGAYRLSLPMANAIVFGKGSRVAQIETGPPTASDSAILDRLARMAYDRLP